jgi:SAM-dependent methyltransferase
LPHAIGQTADYPPEAGYCPIGLLKTTNLGRLIPRRPFAFLAAFDRGGARRLIAPRSKVSAMAEFVVEFGKKGAAPNGGLDAPAFHRNHEAIWSAIAPSLSTQTGDVLELGSGTGQHITTFAARTPRLIWWPSDIYASHLSSIEAWRLHNGLANVRAPQRIDLTDAAWSWKADGQTGPLLAAMLCINVLHISPWAVAQNLIAGARRTLRDGGRLFVYGPFKRDGEHTAPSNAAFDQSLRAENPEWGVRDVADLNTLARDAGLTAAEIAPMPANNLVLAFRRAVRQN